MVRSFARFRCRRGAWRWTNRTTSPAHRRDSVTRSVAEPILEKTADERHVVDDRRIWPARARRASTARMPVPLLNRRQSAWCDLLRGDHALAAQKVEELSQRGRITAVHLHPSSARSQVPCRMLGGDAAQSDGLLSEPSTETRREQHLPVPRIPRVSLLARPLRKRRNVCRQRTLRRPRQDDVAIDDVLHDRLLLPVHGAIEGANYAESLSMIRAKTWPDCQPTRHSPGPGIVPQRV